MTAKTDDGKLSGSGFPVKLAQPALRALQSAGIERLEQLTAFREAEVAKLHGMGPNALGKLGEALLAAGLSFAPEPKGK